MIIKRIFVDSDVVISALLSSTGAAYFLMNQLELTPVISSMSFAELRIVVERLKLGVSKLENVVKKRCEVLKITESKEITQQRYEQFVSDMNDAHIVAGAHQAKVQFLISYNLKHFKANKMRDELDIVVMTPALFLQYLRSN